MRIKEGFERKKIGQHDMVCRTRADGSLDLWFALNETGAFLWDGLVREKDEETLLEELMQEYEAEPDEGEVIKNDVRDYLDQLRRIGVLED